ncbi:MAG: hypothetical protein HOP99_01355, partial [Dermatophilaceae bacterium]|nr:hypothetical protein [Dermatophilaceae bacterium]
MSIWGRWTRYRRAQRARMDTLLARDLGLDPRVPDGAEATDDGAGPPVAEH